MASAGAAVSGAVIRSLTRYSAHDPSCFCRCFFILCFPDHGGRRCVRCPCCHGRVCGRCRNGRSCSHACRRGRSESAGGLVAVFLAHAAGAPDALLSGRTGAGRRGASAAGLSAADLCRRGAAAAGAAGRGGGGPGLPAAGGRLRRKLRHAGWHGGPRDLPRDAADGGGADLRCRPQGGEGGADGRTVCQAAFGRHRSPAWRDAAQLSRRYRQWSRFHGRGPDTRSGADAARLFGQRLDAEPDPCAGGGRFCRPASAARLDGRFRAGQPAGAALPGAGRPHRRGPGLHAGLRFCGRGGFTAACGGFLHLARGAAAGLRGSADPAGNPHPPRSADPPPGSRVAGCRRRWWCWGGCGRGCRGYPGGRRSRAGGRRCRGPAGGGLVWCLGAHALAG